MTQEKADLQGLKVQFFRVCPIFRWQFPQADKLRSIILFCSLPQFTVKFFQFRLTQMDFLVNCMKLMVLFLVYLSNGRLCLCGVCGRCCCCCCCFCCCWENRIDDTAVFDVVEWEVGISLFTVVVVGL